MKERIKKFYHDHEYTLNVIATTAGITTVFVATAVARAAAKDHKIVDVTSVITDDRDYLLITKKNGEITDRFSRPLKEE